jgi:hypothetical protein
MSVKDLYDVDFVEWAARNVQLLRSGRLHEIDAEHVAEEIESMANRDRRQRDRIELALRSAPSLQNYAEEILPAVYAKAVRDAADDTGLPPSSFPSGCPFDLAQILDHDYLPE